MPPSSRKLSRRSGRRQYPFVSKRVNPIMAKCTGPEIVETCVNRPRGYFGHKRSCDLHIDIIKHRHDRLIVNSRLQAGMRSFIGGVCWPYLSVLPVMLLADFIVFCQKISHLPCVPWYLLSSLLPWIVLNAWLRTTQTGKTNSPHYRPLRPPKRERPRYGPPNNRLLQSKYEDRNF